LKRTEEYFSSMIEEARMSVSKATFERNDNALDRARDKLSSLEAQKRHHLQDVVNRYTVRSEVALLDTVLYMVPRRRVSYRCVATSASAPRASEGTAWWDDRARCFMWRDDRLTGC
jgi:hypothetical protein